MNIRDAFLKRLAENENDSSARQDFADWLDEQGEYDEADRQRAWPQARQALRRLCQSNSLHLPIPYDELMAFGRQVAREDWAKGPPERVYINNRDLWRVLSEHSQEFWKNWSIVTGEPLPAGLLEKDFHHWVCCAHEVYYWFGLPDPEDADHD